MRTAAGNSEKASSPGCLRSGISRTLHSAARRLIATVLGAFAIAAAAGSAGAWTLDGDYFTHDPSRITKCDGVYYVYCTAPNVQMRYSRDMINWTVGESVLNGVPAWAHRLVPKAKPDENWVWAPDVIRVGSLYYLYYSFSTFGSKTSVIGLVTSPTLNPHDPKYHWTERGLVVASNDAGNFNAIDPCPVYDANGGLWLTFGSWNSGGIQIVKLDKNTGKPAGAQRLLAGGQASGPEAPFLWYRKPYYYLYENEGTCCQGVRSTYRIMMGRSKSITGPYLDKNGKDLAKGFGTMFMGSHGSVAGPGHMGIYTAADGDRFSYHYYDAKSNGRPTFGIDKLSWKNGWPEAPPAAKPHYDIADGIYAIVSAHNGMALTAPASGSADGTAITQRPYAAGHNQRWRISNTGDGCYKITALDGGRVIDLWTCSAADGTKVDLYRWLDNGCQRWKIEKAADGFRIVAFAGGGSITADGGAGAEVKEFAFHGKPGQIWRFTRL